MGLNHCSMDISAAQKIHPHLDPYLVPRGDSCGVLLVIVQQGWSYENLSGQVELWTRQVHACGCMGMDCKLKVMLFTPIIVPAVRILGGVVSDLKKWSG